MFHVLEVLRYADQLACVHRQALDQRERKLLLFLVHVPLFPVFRRPGSLLSGTKSLVKSGVITVQSAVRS